MNRILVTNEFCNCVKKMVSDNMHEEIHDLRTILIRLANNFPITERRYKDHRLTNSKFRDVHISGKLVLLYKKDSDNDENIIVSLKLATVTEHKLLNKNAQRDNYDYHEISTNELYDITTSTDILSNYEQEFLYDFMETLADYASGHLDNGYVYLSSYYIADNELHGLYDYIDFDDNEVLDNIDFIIDLDLYAPKCFAELNRYVNKFSRILGDEFSEIDK